MTKAEYLASMEAALSEFDAASRAEIILECVKSFSTGELSGKTEQQVIDELGSVEECVEAMRELTFAPATVKKAEQHEAPFTLPAEEDYAKTPKLLLELCADVVVKTADVDVPIIDIRGSKHLVELCVQELNGDALHVYSRKNNDLRGAFAFGRRKLDVAVTLPRQMREVILKLSGGDCRLEGARSDALTIATGGGDTVATDCIANELTSSTAGGAHSFHNIAAKKLTCTSGGGDITLTDANVLELTLKTGGEDINITNVNAVTADMKTGGGDITASEFAASDCRAQTGGGNIDISGDAISKLFAKTGGGDIQINCAALGDTNAITGSGYVSITSSDCSGAKIEYPSARGDISIQFKGESVAYKGNDAITVGDGANRYIVKSGWGDISIRLG